MAQPPSLPKLVIPKITVASLAVYSVMGGLGGLIWNFGQGKQVRGLGQGLTIAAFVGAGYAVSHAIVANVAPAALDGLDATSPQGA